MSLSLAPTHKIQRVDWLTHFYINLDIISFNVIRRVLLELFVSINTLVGLKMVPQILALDWLISLVRFKGGNSDPETAQSLSIAGMYKPLSCLLPPPNPPPVPKMIFVDRPQRISKRYDTNGVWSSFFFLFYVVISAGVGRTGVFCALSILIERLKSEGVVDVFQTIKLLRSQRPAMVQTKVRSCSSSFNTY